MLQTCWCWATDPDMVHDNSLHCHPDKHGPLMVTKPPAGAQTSGIHVTFGDTMSNSHQFRACCGRTMNPDTVAVQATQIAIAHMAAWPSGTNKVPGCGPDLWHWHSLRWYHEPWTATQPLAVRKPVTQTWLSVAALARLAPWPQVTAQATKISMAPVAAWPLGTNMVTRSWPRPGHQCDLW